MRLRNKINLYTSVLFIILLIIMNKFIYYLLSTMKMESELYQAYTDAELVVRGIN